MRFGLIHRIMTDALAALGLLSLLASGELNLTSVRLLVDRWVGPSGTFNKPSAGEHDALVDTRNSIAELRHYRAVLGK